MSEAVCVDVDKVIGDFVYHREPEVYSRLFKGLPVEVCKHFGHAFWALGRNVIERWSGWLYADVALKLWCGFSCGDLKLRLRTQVRSELWHCIEHPW